MDGTEQTAQELMDEWESLAWSAVRTPKDDPARQVLTEAARQVEDRYWRLVRAGPYEGGQRPAPTASPASPRSAPRRSGGTPEVA